MSSIAVVGGGLGGMAAAARLAKLGHQVTVLESLPTLGGALSATEHDGFVWDAGATSTLLPAVLRDLFRKSGRPLERELDLVAQPLLAQHRFSDARHPERAVTLDLPAGRGGQQEAIGTAMGADAAAAWTAYVDGYADTWEVLRQEWLERPFSPDSLSSRGREVLDARRTLRTHVRRSLRDERLRRLAGWSWEMAGQDPRDVPAALGAWTYVEQRFARWRVPGGMHRLAATLADRLGTRGVTVLTGVHVRDVVLAGSPGRAVGVRTDEGTVSADAVVLAVDPRALPSLGAYVERTMPAIPPVVCHVGLVGEVPPVPDEVVLHGEATIVVRPGGTAPDGAHAWTLLGRGRLSEDIVTAVHRAGLPIRDRVVVRVDRSPRDQVLVWGGSPAGVRWQGRATFRRTLGPRTPVAGLYLAGAHASPGAGIPQVGLSAAQVAAVIGPA